MTFSLCPFLGGQGLWHEDQPSGLGVGPPISLFPIFRQLRKPRPSDCFLLSQHFGRTPPLMLVICYLWTVVPTQRGSHS